MPGIDLPLRDIHLPSDISWWPLAPGWWLVFILIFIILGAVFIVVNKFLQPSLKKQALKELKAIEKSFQKHGNAASCLAEISLFLRRFSLFQNHTKPMAGLIGQQWLQYLDQTLESAEFSNSEIGKVLLTAPYQPQVDNEKVQPILQLCRKWVKRL